MFTEHKFTLIMKYNMGYVFEMLKAHNFQNEELFILLNRYYAGRDFAHTRNNTALINEMNRIFMDSIRSEGRFNLFPCDNCPSSCQELLVGIAELGFETKETKGKLGFRSLMARLYPYWFDCDCNRTNIIFTSNFDRNKFNDFYLPTFKVFWKKFKRKIIIIEIAKDDFYLQYDNSK